MGRYSCLVVLWNIHDKQRRVLNEPGHFFLVSTRGPEPCVVFSSTGMTPKKELFITQSDPSLLERILPKGTVYNNFKFQVGNDSQTCWRWQIIWAHLAQMGLKKFKSLFYSFFLIEIFKFLVRKIFLKKLKKHKKLKFPDEIFLKVHLLVEENRFEAVSERSQ